MWKIEHFSLFVNQGRLLRVLRGRRQRVRRRLCWLLNAGRFETEKKTTISFPINNISNFIKQNPAQLARFHLRHWWQQVRTTTLAIPRPPFTTRVLVSLSGGTTTATPSSLGHSPTTEFPSHTGWASKTIVVRAVTHNSFFELEVRKTN